jgi:hypothetical protein
MIAGMPSNVPARKKFTPSEDAMLMCLVAQFGRFGWDVISSKMHNRNPRQCRERWKHYLSVGFEDRAWTKAEDDLLLEKEEQIGQRWTKLTAFFHNRSDIQIKARWVKLMEKKKGIADTQIANPAPKHDNPGPVFDLDERNEESCIDVLYPGSPAFEPHSGMRSADMTWF